MFLTAMAGNPVAHLPQEISTPSFLAASWATGLPAIAVRNIAEVTVLTCRAVNVRKAPRRFRDSSGSGLEFSSLLSEATTGYTTPPHRAVFDGVAGARIRSVSAMP